MKNRIFIWLTFSSLSLTTHFAFSQAPALGGASIFALFTANGAFDNLGLTVINGEIGTNVGAYTGFPPGTLNGSAHIADGVSAQVANDVNTAYDFLVASACDTVIGVLLGNGQVLPPKVYCLGGASSLTGDLILDGRGDPNSLFIIKIDGALSASSFSNVVLTDSASWCNVYWQVNGAFSLGNDAVFGGTLINNGAISLLENSDIIGRGLSIAGAIQLHNNNVTNDCSGSPILPIGLVSYVANCENRNVLINWSTSSEINNDFFSLERSSDAVNWQIVGTTNGAGNSNMLINYSFTDPYPFAHNTYYRLKQVDFDGAFIYSELISFKNCASGFRELYIYPNPTQGPINISIGDFATEIVAVSIYNAFGTLIYQTSKLHSMIDLSNEPAGIYFLTVQSENERINRKFSIIK